MRTELEMEIMSLLVKIGDAYDDDPWGETGEGRCRNDPAIREMIDRVDMLCSRWAVARRSLLDS